MLRIMVIIGTRPEAIKMAPVVKEIGKFPEYFQPLVCVTGQHREMLDQVLDIFKIKPDFDLNIMTPNQSLASLTARLTMALDEVITQSKPDWILVQGDTTSAMVASLVGFYHNVKVGHIEAGLRTHNLRQPFPEEVNRRITDIVSDLYFSPTERTRDNLLREGVRSEAIVVTGNTVIDALLMTAERVRERPLPDHIPAIYPKWLILVTSHRRENFGEPFAAICQAVKEIAEKYLECVHVVFPVHYNPNVRTPAFETLDGIANVTLIDPVDYETMVCLMARANLIMTDSGGVQEESPSLNKPMLIMRDVTERQEVVEVGAGVLVGTDREKIVREAVRLLENQSIYQQMAAAPSPYGDGYASKRIIQTIMDYHGTGQTQAIVA